MIRNTTITSRVAYPTGPATENGIPKNTPELNLESIARAANVKMGPMRYICVAFAF